MSFCRLPPAGDIRYLILFCYKSASDIQATSVDKPLIIAGLSVQTKKIKQADSTLPQLPLTTDGKNHR